MDVIEVETAFLFGDLETKRFPTIMKIYNVGAIYFWHPMQV